MLIGLQQSQVGIPFAAPDCVGHRKIHREGDVLTCQLAFLPRVRVRITIVLTVVIDLMAVIPRIYWMITPPGPEACLKID